MTTRKKNKISILKIGEISEPIQISNGYLFLKLNDKREIKKKLDLKKELKQQIEFEKKTYIANTNKFDPLALIMILKWNKCTAHAHYTFCFF